MASAAYQSRDSFKDERLNQTFNYRHKGGDYQSGFILSPEGAPAWMLNSESLWNGVEAFEDALIYERFRGDHKDPIKRQKSLAAREKALSSAQTAWTTTVALPRELIYKQNEELLRSYLYDQFVKKGLVVQCDIHKDPGNPHAHIMVTMRAVEGDRFAQTKITSQRYLPGEGVTFFSRDHLKNVLRADWAAYANRMLERHGWDVRIDHRTLEEQEVSRLKTDHEGYYARLIEARGGVARICAENREIAAANLNQYLSNPVLIINDLAREKVVFSKQDIMTFLQKHAGNNETLFLSLKQALSEVKLPNYIFKSANNNIRFDSEEIKQELDDLLRDSVTYVLKNDALVSLGESLFKHELFTSQEQRQRETATLKLIEQAAGNKAVGALHAKKIEQAIVKTEAKTGFTYSDEQRQAISYLTAGGQLKVLEGRAGTGKSTVLKPVVEAYQQAGYRVMGAAFQGIIADALATELGIPAHTLDKYTYQWGDTQKAGQALRTAKGETKTYLKQKVKKSWFYEPDAKTVFIVDEGSMVKHDHYHKLLEQVTKSGAKLIVVQDQHQFKALTGADISAELSKRADAVYLKDVFRQQTPWQRQATACLNDHRLEEGLYAYERNNRLHLGQNQESAKAALLKQYLEDFKAYPQERLTILTFENRHVDFFNAEVFKALLQDGHLKDPFTIKGRSFAVGAHVLFTRNDNVGEFVKTVEGHGKGIKNGSFGVITGYDPATKTCAVQLETGRLVRFNTEAYTSLSLGYAMTTMKSQGKTVFRSYSYIDQVRSANDMLVGLSRHRDDCFIYASQEQYSSFRELAKAASASQYQGLAEAYAVSAEDKPSYDLVGSYKEVSRQVGELGFALSEQMHNREVDETTKQAFERAKSERQVLARQILDAYPQCHPYLKQGRIGIETLEDHAGLRARLYTLPEQQALARVEQFFDAALAAKTLRAEMLQTHPGVLIKQHSSYDVYERYLTARDQMAYEISKAKPLHRPFFRLQEVTVGSDADGNPITHYESKGGKRYAHKPAPMMSCLSYAERYEATLRQDYFKETLFGAKRAFYEQCLQYQAAVRSYGSAYATLKNQTDLLHAPGTKEVLQNAMHSHAEGRDHAAISIIRSLMADSKGDLERFFKQLSFKQDPLLQHAVQGEVREIIRKHDKAATLDERLTQARILYKFVFGAEGSTCDKRLYAFAKEIGVDWNQVRFERGYGEMLTAGQSTKYTTLDQLKAAYVPLKDYLTVAQAGAKEWTVLKETGTKMLDDLQDQAITVFNQRFTTVTLSKDSLAAQALEAIGAKAGNLNVQGHISRALIQAYQGQGQQGLAALPEAVQTLATLVPHTTKGTTGYVSLANPNLKSQADHWLALKAQKRELALTVEQQAGELIRLKFPHLHPTLTQEARYQRAAQEVTTFLQASAREQAELAPVLKQMLEQETSVSYLKTALKQQGSHTFEQIYLLDKIAALQASVSPAIYEQMLASAKDYIKYKAESSARWTPYREAAQTALKLELAEQHLAQEYLGNLLSDHGFNRQHRFEVEHLLRSVTAALQSPAKDSQQVIEKWYTTKLPALSPEAKANLTSVILDVARQERALNEECHQLAFAKLAEHPADHHHLLKVWHDRKITAQRLLSLGLKEALQQDAHWSLKDLLRYDEKQERINAKLTNVAVSSSKSFTHEQGPEDGPAVSEAKTFRESKPMSQPRLELSNYEWQALCDRISTAAVHHQSLHSYLRSTLAHEKVTPSRHEVRFGRKGSFVLKTGGPKAGTYYNHERGEGGNLIQFCQREMQMSFKEAMLYLAEAAPYSDQQTVKQLFDPDARGLSVVQVGQKQTTEAQFIQGKAEAEAQVQHLQAQKQAEVATLAGLSLPIQGTQGKAYLRNTRHIQGSLPESLRYLPEGTAYTYDGKERTIKHGALLSLAHDTHTKELQAVQITYLDGIGNRALDAQGNTFIKVTHGQLSGAVVTLQHDAFSNRVLIAEGVETALSIKEAGVQGTILCSLGTGNLKNLDLHGKDIVLLADWDGGYDKPSWQTLQRSQDTLQQKNTSVSIVLPCEHPALTKEKLDFNDVLKQDGLSSLQALLVKQGLKDEPARTHPKEKGIISHEQTEQPSQARSAVQTGQDHLAPHQQEHSIDAQPCKTAEGHSTVEGVVANKDAATALKEVRTYTPREQHILSYLEEQLNPEKHTWLNQKYCDELWKVAQENPAKAFERWSNVVGLESHAPWEEAATKNAATQAMPSSIDTFCNTLNALETEIKEFTALDPKCTHVMQLKDTKESLITEFIKDDTQVQTLKEARPEVFEKLQDRFQQEENQKQYQGMSLHF